MMIDDDDDDDGYDGEGNHSVVAAQLVPGQPCSSRDIMPVASSRAPMRLPSSDGLGSSNTAGRVLEAPTGRVKGS